MVSEVVITGDGLLELLGRPASDPDVQSSLSQLAHGMQPELDPDDEEIVVDWITVNELGLEYGFEDEAFIRALDPDERRRSPLLLSQLYFYADTPVTRPFPYPLPFGLSFDDDKASVRSKLVAHEDTRRSYIRDAWRLPEFNVTVAYRGADSRVESVFCYLRYEPWPTVPGETELVASFTPDTFAGLFGLRWSNAELRARLAPLGFHEELPDVRWENMADLRRSHGLELGFALSSEIPGADQRYPDTLAFAEVTFFSSRELDAREWSGALPCSLAFSDTQAELLTKVGETPAEQSDDKLSGVAVWHLPDYTLQVLYSNLENRLLRVTLIAPGYWESGEESRDL